MIKLREYQKKCVDAIFNYFSNVNFDGNPLIEAATGAGKSIIVAEFIRRLYAELNVHTKVLVMAHVKELIVQNSEKLKMVMPEGDIGIFCSALKKRQYKNEIIFCSIQSVHKKADLFGEVGIVIVDECHLLSPNDQTIYKKFINQLKEKNPFLKIIGFTATPYRLDSGCMVFSKNALFDDFCYRIKAGELIKKGYLSKITSYPTITEIDTSGVKKIKGEFAEGELQEVMVEAMSKYMPEVIAAGEDRQSWLIFAAGLRHCELVKNWLSGEGIDCEVITGSTPQDERDEILRRFKDRGLQCLINNAVLTTGTDLPCIDMIVLLRATMSAGLYVQMVGRGMRLYEGKKDCLLLDFGGNASRFGLIDDIQATKKGDGNGKDEAPSKECPECEAQVHAARKGCPECGYEFPPPEKKIINQFHIGAVVHKDDAPIIARQVDKMFITMHEKEGRTMAKITLICGAISVYDFINLEPLNSGAKFYAYRKLQEYTGKQGVQQIYKTNQDLLDNQQDLRKPIEIYIRKSGRFWEIVKRVFASKVVEQGSNIITFTR